MFGVGVVLLGTGWAGWTMRKSKAKRTPAWKRWGDCSVAQWTPGVSPVTLVPISMRAVRLSRAYRVIRRISVVLFWVVLPGGTLLGLVGIGIGGRGGVLGALEWSLIGLVVLLLVARLALGVLRVLVGREVLAHAEVDDGQQPDLEVVRVVAAGEGTFSELGVIVGALSAALLMACAAVPWVDDPYFTSRTGFAGLAVVASAVALLLGGLLLLLGRAGGQAVRIAMAKRWP